MRFQGSLYGTVQAVQTSVYLPFHFGVNGPVNDFHSPFHQLWAARRNALPALASLNNTCIVEDATVPRSRITEMLVACEKIATKYNVTIGTFGHAGDGNLHPTILYDMYDKDETARVHEAIDEIFATALALDGTLSGEHGIGMAKMKYLGNELGQSGLNLMKCIKESLDPEYLLNPGKMVPMKEV